MTKFELTKEILIDKRDAFYEESLEFINNSVKNGDITEDEAEELNSMLLHD